MIGIIGAGNMGSAIASRIASSIVISDMDTAKLHLLKSEKIETTKDNTYLAKRSDIIILAVKPQDMPNVLREIKPYVKDKLIISIAAGIESSFIQKLLGRARVIRVMPNMPLLVGKGISAIAKGKFAAKRDLKAAKNIFSKMGEVLEVNEELMHAVTALSGSGPAYYFLFTGILEKAGIECGLRKDLADKLAISTFIGTAKIAEDKKIPMQEFVKKVASKGGTTEAALKVFKDKNLEDIVKLAVKSACKRSKDLTSLRRRRG